MKLKARFYCITTGGVYRVTKVDFEKKEIAGFNKQGTILSSFEDAIWLDRTGLKCSKGREIYIDDFVLALKDDEFIICGVVKKRADGLFVIENKKIKKQLPLMDLQASGVKIVNLYNHKLYFARKNNK